MTSENSSLVKTKKKTYKIRFSPLTVVALIWMLLFYISAIIVLVNRAYTYGINSLQDPSQIRFEQINAVSKIIGFRQLGIAFVIVLAVVYALSEFNYLFSQKQLDFFVSQPTSSRKRFFQRYIDGVLTFSIIYLIVLVVSLLLALALGAFNKVLLLEVLCALIYVYLVFFAFYNISILGVMLSGNLFTAILMTIFWSAIFSVASVLLGYYREIFFITYSNLTSEINVLSPVVDVINVIGRCSAVFGNETGRLAMDNLCSMISASYLSILDIVATSIVALVFALFAYKKRKNEWAGKTICFTLVQKIVKVSLSIIAGLLLGTIIYYMYSEYNSSRNYMILAAMVIGCILSAFIIEVYIQADFKLFYKGIFENIIALAAVVFIFISLNNDIFGYDSYAPAEDKYSSYFLVKYSSYGYLDYYNGYTNYWTDDVRAMELQNRMFLTDKSAMKELADYSNNYVKNTDRERLYENAWQVQVGYRLNSGRIVYRTMYIPYDVDNALMERIVGSKEYVSSFYDVFTDYPNEQGMFELADCSFITESEKKDTVLDDYQKFKLAYQKDLLEYYSYSLANTEDFVGMFEMTNYDYHDDEYYFVDVSYPVYSSYVNTISYLNELGIYIDDVKDASAIKSVSIENYYPGHDLEVEDESTLLYGNETTVEYTDEADITAIMENAVSANMLSDWYPYNRLNNQYGINVIYKDSDKNDTNFYNSYFMFPKGTVPDFVAKDTNY